MADDEKKTTGLSTGELIPQKHGGAIRNGGTNKGGPGRPPSAIRASCRRDFDKLRRILPKIAKDENSKNSDKIRAVEVLGRFGMDSTVRVADVKAALRETQKEIYEFLPRDKADALLAKIRPHWLSL